MCRVAISHDACAGGERYLHRSSATGLAKLLVRFQIWWYVQYFSMISPLKLTCFPMGFFMWISGISPGISLSQLHPAERRAMAAWGSLQRARAKRQSSSCAASSRSRWDVTADATGKTDKFVHTHRIRMYAILMVTLTINIAQMLAYMPYMDPMGYKNDIFVTYLSRFIHVYRAVISAILLHWLTEAAYHENHEILCDRDIHLAKRISTHSYVTIVCKLLRSQGFERTSEMWTAPGDGAGIPPAFIMTMHPKFLSVDSIHLRCRVVLQYFLGTPAFHSLSVSRTVWKI